MSSKSYPHQPHSPFMTKMKNFILRLVFLLALAFPVFSNAGGSISITEIMYDSEGADSGGKASDGTYFSREWIEVFNAAGNAIDLEGWKFNDGANHILNVPPEKGGQGSMVIATGGYAILTDDAATFLRDHPGFLGTVIDTVMSLTNTSKTLTLLDRDGNAVDSITYQNTWGGNGNGYTLAKTDSAWKESAVLGGTPGAPTDIQNNPQENPPTNLPPSTPASPGGFSPDAPPQNQQTENAAPHAKAGVSAREVAVGEEVTFNASGSSDSNGDTLLFGWNFGDGNKSQKEITTHRYDKSGAYNVVLMVSDGKIESYDYFTIIVAEPVYSRFIFINEFLPSPSGPDEENEWIELVNESNESVDLSRWQLDDKEGGSAPFTVPEKTVIGPNSFLVFGRPQTKIALNNEGDAVRLFAPNGSLVHETSYAEKTKEGLAAAMFSSNWEWTESLTPGSSNVYSRGKGAATYSLKDPQYSFLPPITSTVPPPETSAYSKENVPLQGGEPTEERREYKPQSAESKRFISLLPRGVLGISLALAIALGGALGVWVLKKRLNEPL